MLLDDLISKLPGASKMSTGDVCFTNQRGRNILFRAESRAPIVRQGLRNNQRVNVYEAKSLDVENGMHIATIVLKDGDEEPTYRNAYEKPNWNTWTDFFLYINSYPSSLIQ